MKSLLIPVAAFAVTVTGVSAFNSEVLKQAGLSAEQITAFEEAKELREEGNLEEARDKLLDAGIDADVMNDIRVAWHEWRAEHRSEVMMAVEAGDYSAFKEAVKGSPLADIINTKAEFDQFVEAHALMEDGEFEEAKSIFEDLGLKGGEGKGPRFHLLPKFESDSNLTAEQKAELKTAFKERDHDRVREILDAAGIEFPGKGKGFGLGLGLGVRGEAKIESD